jgi:hypothetical protein
MLMPVLPWETIIFMAMVKNQTKDWPKSGGRRRSIEVTRELQGFT